MLMSKRKQAHNVLVFSDNTFLFPAREPLADVREKLVEIPGPSKGFF